MNGRKRSIRGVLCALAVGALVAIALPSTAVATPGLDGAEEPTPLEAPAESGTEGTGEEQPEPPAPAEDEPETPEAEVPAKGEAPSTVTVEGTLVVVPTEFAPIDIVEGEELPEASISHVGSVGLLTESDIVIPLFEGDAHDYATGQAATATFSVPEPVQTEVEQRLAEQGAEEPSPDTAELVDLVVEASADLSEDLEPISHEVTPQVAAAQAALPHIVDVIYLEGAGNTAPAQSSITGLVSKLSTYWNSETGGQISGVTLGDIRIETMPTERCGAGFSQWQWAAGRFGRNQGTYTNSQNRHLIVLESTLACGSPFGNGLATIGSGVHSGGLIWGAVRSDLPTYWNGVVFHEFGHNLSLGHSNTLACSAGHYDTLTFSASGSPTNGSCQVSEYLDLVDVMGMGYTYSTPSGTLSNASNVAALNATHRVKLGSLPESSIRRVSTASSGTQTIDLKPATDSTGVRMIEISVPGVTEKYLLEYRSSQGKDASAFYNRWQGVRGTLDYGPGVRVLRVPKHGDSAVLARPALGGESAASGGKLTYLVNGASFISYGGSFSVRVTSLTPSNARVEVLPAPAVTVNGVRIAGADRFETATAVSKHAFPSATGGTVIVATGLDYPDSLSAAPLGAKLDAPLLLTMPGSLPAVTKTEIQRLKPARIVVVGGTGAVSSAVEQQLRALAPTVQRLSGADRYATSAAISRWGWPEGSTSAFIATGDGFADALSAGAAAGSIDAPVMLVPGSSSNSPVARTLLNEFGVQQLYIAGGTGAVSSAMEASLKGTRTVTRFSGSDRFDTSARISQQFNTSEGRVYLANGLGFADALTGAVAAGANAAPLMLSEPLCVPASIKIAQAQVQPSAIYLLGGAGVLSEPVRFGHVC